MKVLNKEELKKAEEVLSQHFPQGQQIYGHVCMINRTEADPIDILVDQWPDFSVIFVRPKRLQKSDLFKVIRIFAKDETILRNILIGTDVLDWKQFFRLNLDLCHEDMLKSVAVSRGVPMSKTYVCHLLKLQDPSNLTTERYLLICIANTISEYAEVPKKLVHQSNIWLPVQVSSLNESHIALVNSTWKLGRGEFSERFITDMMMNFPSYCVLDSEGQPVSWILTYASCALGMLYTLPDHRRKGYAKALVTIMAKKLHSEGYPVYCLIEEVNHMSYRLFTSLGFTEDPSYRVAGFEFN